MSKRSEQRRAERARKQAAKAVIAAMRRRTAARRGPNYWIGRSLVRLCQEAGMSKVEACEHVLADLESNRQ